MQTKKIHSVFILSLLIFVSKQVKGDINNNKKSTSENSLSIKVPSFTNNITGTQFSKKDLQKISSGNLNNVQIGKLIQNNGKKTYDQMLLTKYKNKANSIKINNEEIKNLNKNGIVKRKSISKIDRSNNVNPLKMMIQERPDFIIQGKNQITIEDESINDKESNISKLEIIKIKNKKEKVPSKKKSDQNKEKLKILKNDVIISYKDPQIIKDIQDIEINCLCGPQAKIENREFSEYERKSKHFIIDYLEYQKTRYNSIIDQIGSQSHVYPRISQFIPIIIDNNENEIFQVYKAKFGDVRIFAYYRFDEKNIQENLILTNKPKGYLINNPIYMKSGKSFFNYKIFSQWFKTQTGINWEVTQEMKEHEYFEMKLDVNFCFDFFNFINKMFRKQMIAANAYKKNFSNPENFADLISGGKGKKLCINHKKISSEMFMEKGRLKLQGQSDSQEDELETEIERLNKLKDINIRPRFFERLNTIKEQVKDENEESGESTDEDLLFRQSTTRFNFDDSFVEQEENQKIILTQEEIDKNLLEIKIEEILKSSRAKKFQELMDYLEEKKSQKVKDDINEMIRDDTLFSNYKTKWLINLKNPSLMTNENEYCHLGRNNIIKYAEVSNNFTQNNIDFSQINVFDIKEKNNQDINNIWNESQTTNNRLKIEKAILNMYSISINGKAICSEKSTKFVLENLNKLNDQEFWEYLTAERNQFLRKKRFIFAFVRYLSNQFINIVPNFIKQNKSPIETNFFVEISKNLSFFADLSLYKEHLYTFLREKFNYRGIAYKITEEWNTENINDYNVEIITSNTFSLVNSEKEEKYYCKNVPFSNIIDGYDINEIMYSIENQNGEGEEEDDLESLMTTRRRYIV